MFLFCSVPITLKWSHVESPLCIDLDLMFGLGLRFRIQNCGNFYSFISSKRAFQGIFLLVSSSVRKILNAIDTKGRIHVSERTIFYTVCKGMGGVGWGLTHV